MKSLVIPPSVEWELLVVNNNSSDATNEVISSFAHSLPIKLLFEPKPGKSHALNMATQQAQGDYILWTDDDVLVDKNWIVEYCAAFAKWPDAVVFGGRIDPWFAGKPAKWLMDVIPQVSLAFALQDYGSQPFPLTGQVEKIPFGANLAFRTAEQRQYLYDPRLGPKPNTSIRGEERAVVVSMLNAGLQGWWIPTACVSHYVPKERQTVRYLRSYYYGSGELLALQREGWRQPELWGKPKWLWKSAIEAEFIYRYHRVFSKPQVWINHLKNSSIYWGGLGLEFICPHER